MKTLIIIDVQNDFLPGGALAVADGDAILSIINQLIPKFKHVIATQDWHPRNHISFETLWPKHCIQNSSGAELATGLHQERIEAIFQKGVDPEIDSYSAFFDNERKRQTGLEAYLRKHRLKDLYFVGLATDYCVLYSVLDALELGFNVYVIRDACRAIDAEGGELALKKMQAKGANMINSVKL